MTLPDHLTFQDTDISIIDRDGMPWLASADLARALGYSRPDNVTRIYERNKDEFSDDMSQTVNLTVSGNLQKTSRIFSARGCHLVAMFSHTKRAKAFRRWVLDVLDVGKAAPSQPRLQHRPDAAGGDKRWIVPIDQRTHVATRIQDLREAQGISRRDLAARLGMNKYTVLRWERAETMPDRNAIKVLAKALSVDVKDILAGEVLPPDQQPAPPPSRPQGPRLNDDPEGYYQKHIAAHKEAYREMQESLKEARRQFDQILDQIAAHNAAQFSHAEHAKTCRRMIKAN